MTGILVVLALKNVLIDKAVNSSIEDQESSWLTGPLQRDKAQRLRQLRQLESEGTLPLGIREPLKKVMES